MDDAWQRERELERMRSRPSHVGSGLMYETPLLGFVTWMCVCVMTTRRYGFKDLGMGFYNGVTGVFEKPLDGLTKEGGFGFLKGIGLGVSGAVIKPVVGAIDLVTKTTVRDRLAFSAIVLIRGM